MVGITLFDVDDEEWFARFEPGYRNIPKDSEVEVVGTNRKSGETYLAVRYCDRSYNIRTNAIKLLVVKESVDEFDHLLEIVEQKYRERGASSNAAQIQMRFVYLNKMYNLFGYERLLELITNNFEAYHFMVTEL